MSPMAPRALLVAVAVGLASAAAVLACNALLGNEPVELEGVDATAPPRRDAGSDSPVAADAPAPSDSGSGDGGPLCPAPTCTSAVDCPVGHACIGTGDGDGGVLTRACRRTCEGGVGCAAYESCFTGNPLRACIPTGTLCGSACTTLCGTTCVDLFRDRTNCGSCGNLCPAGKVCNGGSCS